MGIYHVTDRHGKRHALKSVWYSSPTIASLRPAYDYTKTMAAYREWLASTGRDAPNDERSWETDPRPAYITEGDTLPRFKTVMGYGPKAWTLYSDWWKPCQPDTKEEIRARKIISSVGIDAFQRGDYVETYSGATLKHAMAEAAD